MEFPDRLRTIIKVNNLTPSSFADKVGVQRSGVSHILNGRNRPSMDFLVRVLKEFPRVDAAWLITGESPRNEPGNSEKGEIIESEFTKPSELEHPSPKVKKSDMVEKEPVRVVIFYSDNTFDTYLPS